LKAKINDKNFYYNELTKEITEDILENLSLGIKYDQTQYHWPYHLKIDDEEESLNFTYSVGRIPSKDFIKNDIIGSSGLDDFCLPHVTISMLIKEKKWIKNHSYTFSEIAGVVAHELHHLTQDFELSVMPTENTPIVNYFLNPIEIEAFHIGFRAESSFSNTTIEMCIEKYLNNFLNNNSINTKDYQKIFVKWLKPEIKLLKGASGNES
tara:strand:- start:319 stop:945 length:627 start_codon:yes stop_codon:yes gene_type:complete